MSVPIAFDYDVGDEDQNEPLFHAFIDGPASST